LNHRHIAIVSHRWLKPGQAFDSAKTERLQNLLAENPHIELVWIDWSSMPQGKSSDGEKRYFKLILPIVNILYSTLTVIIMVDQQYIGRFWTQLECFLALRLTSQEGLVAVTSEDRGSRCLFIEMGASEGTGGLAALLKGTWGPGSVQEAHERLAKPDVQVTNQKDKTQQLEKLLQLDKRLRSSAREESRMSATGEVNVTMPPASTGHLEGKESRLKAELEHSLALPEILQPHQESLSSFSGSPQEELRPGEHTQENSTATGESRFPGRHGRRLSRELERTQPRK